jgi:hypothetical protein
VDLGIKKKKEKKSAIPALQYAIGPMGGGVSVRVYPHRDVDKQGHLFVENKDDKLT